MLFQLKLALVPILTLAIAPTVKAAVPMVPAAAPENAVVVAQMTQLYCTTYAPAGGIGLTVYDAPNGNVINRLQDGITVAYNLGDRSGNWAEVSSGDGTTGWVETVFLGCEDSVSDFSETSEEYYEETYEEYYSEEYYTEETYEESYTEEYYEESYEETEEFYSY